MSQPKHRERAIQAIAEHRCVTDLTNGFCGGPRDGKCARKDAGCLRSAQDIMRSLENRGMSVIWEHDPANHVDPFINAAELAAIKGLE